CGFSLCNPVLSVVGFLKFQPRRARILRASFIRANQPTMKPEPKGSGFFAKTLTTVDTELHGGISQRVHDHVSVLSCRADIACPILFEQLFTIRSQIRST